MGLKVVFKELRLEPKLLNRGLREKQTTNERTEIFSSEKLINGYPRKEKKSGLRTKMKSFHSGYSDQEVRIKVYPF